MSMDALEFLRERKRLCNSYEDCDECLFDEGKCATSNYVMDEDYKRVIATVEQWVKAHPRKTRQSEFLKQWPEAEIDTCGYLMVCPKRMSADCRIRYGNCADRLCSDCRREFWSQEVE